VSGFLGNGLEWGFGLKFRGCWLVCWLFCCEVDVFGVLIGWEGFLVVLAVKFRRIYVMVGFFGGLFWWICIYLWLGIEFFCEIDQAVPTQINN